MSKRKYTNLKVLLPEIQRMLAEGRSHSVGARRKQPFGGADTNTDCSQQNDAAVLLHVIAGTKTHLFLRINNKKRGCYDNSVVQSL